MSTVATREHRLAPLDRQDAALICAFVLVLIATRLAWMTWSLGSASWWEEEYRWVAAREIVSGPLQPILDYQADHYQGGPLVMILIGSGLFRLLGESPVVLKLAAVLFSCGTLTLLYVVARKAFGRTVGVCAALAYLAGPSVLAWMSLLVMGSHTESILFSLAEILVFLGLLTGEWRTWRGWLALGVIGGLGLWFCYTSGLTLAACALTWLALEGMPKLRELAWAIAGLIPGLLLWLVYNAQHGFIGGRRIVELFGVGDPIDPWLPQTATEKLASLLLFHWPIGLTAASPAVVGGIDLLVALGFAIPLAAALGFAAWRVFGVPLATRLGVRATETPEHAESRRRETVFLVYGVLFLAFYLGSRFTIDPNLGPMEYRLLLPATVLLLIPAAYSFARGLAQKAALRAAALASLALFLTATATGTGAFAYELSAVGEPFSPLYGQIVRGMLLHRKYESDLIRAVEVARLLPDEKSRTHVFTGIGWGLEYRFESNADPAPIETWLARLDGHERRGLLWGIRWAADRRKESLDEQRRLGTGRPDLELQVKRLDAVLAIADRARRQKPKPGPRAKRPAPNAPAMASTGKE